MTPCEMLGYKAGDEFIVTTINNFPKGCTIVLDRDDTTSRPRFSGPSLDGDGWAYESLDNVTKVSLGDSLDLNAYTKIEHPDGRIEFIPQSALQGGTKEEPKVPESYIAWDAKGGGEAYYSQIDHHVLPLSSCDGDDYMQECLLDSYKLYPTNELAAKASKLRERSDAIIKACLLIDPKFNAEWCEVYSYAVYYDHSRSIWLSEEVNEYNYSVASVSSKEKAQQVCDLLTKWGIK